MTDSVTERYVPYSENPKYWIYDSGKVYSEYRKKFLKPRISSGYYGIKLSGNKMMRIHRLVALHFIENDDPNKTIVNHKDSNRLNNHYTNLEWVTYKENADHAVKQGNYAKGNNLRPVVKCNYETKEIIREYESASEASRCTGKSLAMINRICDSQRVFENKKRGVKYFMRWKHVKEKIDCPENAVQFRNFNVFVCPDGNIWSAKMKNFLKFSPNKDGYLRTAFKENGETKNFFVHRIVGECFIENPDNLPQIHHKDGNRENNCCENLQWVSSSENSIFTYTTGARQHILRPVDMLDPDSNEVIRSFPSVSKAAIFIGATKGNFSNILRSSHKTFGGYKWKYQKE